LLNAAAAAGRVLTDEQRASISATADAYASATEKLEQMRKAQERVEELNNAFRDTFKGFVSDLRSGLQEGATFWDSFSQAATNALNRISDKLMDMAINQLWEQAFPTKGGGGGFLASLFGGPTGVGLHNPGGYSAAFPMPIGVPVAHDGYSPGQIGLPTRYMHSAYFEAAPRFHAGKLPWNPATEMPAIIDRREEVNYPDALARKYGGAQQQVIYSVTIVNNAGSKVTEKRTQNNSGGIDLTVTIDEAAAAKVASGESNLNRALESRYGLDPTRGMMG
jgi:hypothetical protein